MDDKRVHPRVPIAATVACERSGAPALQGTAKDISIGGMYIESSEPVTFGLELTIVLRLPKGKADSRLPAIVRWIKPGGFGVQFQLLGARETHAISELMKP